MHRFGWERVIRWPRMVLSHVTIPPLGSPAMLRSLSRLRAPLAIVAISAATACYQDPQEQMDRLQLITDMDDAVNALNSRTSELIFTLDSLRNVVARQDTAIARLANLAGVPYRR